MIWVHSMGDLDRLVPNQCELVQVNDDGTGIVEWPGNSALFDVASKKVLF